MADFEREWMEAFEPEQWYVTFHRRSSRRWVNWLAVGQYKHVSAFGYVIGADVWVFVDFLASRMRVRVATNSKANVLLGLEADAGTVIKMPDMDRENRQSRFRPGFWCVPMTAHLIGLGGCALRPDRLFAQCLANGGTIVSDQNDEIRPERGSACQATEGGGAARKH